MKYNKEKEFLKICYLNGSLDITRDFKTVEKFIEIFKDDHELCLSSIEFCKFLSKDEIEELDQIITGGLNGI